MSICIFWYLGLTSNQSSRLAVREARSLNLLDVEIGFSAMTLYTVSTAPLTST